MERFTAGWLALREPADHASRSAPLTRAVTGTLSHAAPLNVLDLAAGTGSNLRYLADHLSGEQRWLLVDHDPALLARVSSRMPRNRPLCRVETRQLDLAALDAAADRGIFAGRELVTASALLDLVSETWLRALVARCRERGAAVLFALNYDGRTHGSPEEPEDAAIRDLVNRHQRTDKGFGPALGPDAADAAERCLTSLGYLVRRAPSDWVLASGSNELQRHVIEGWAQAATAVAPAQAAMIGGWRSRRLAHVAGSRSRLTIGHQDLAGWLPGKLGRGETR
jgi:hypothetical protein